MCLHIEVSHLSVLSLISQSTKMVKNLNQEFYLRAHWDQIFTCSFPPLQDCLEVFAYFTVLVKPQEKKKKKDYGKPTLWLFVYYQFLENKKCQQNLDCSNFTTSIPLEE